MTPKAETSVDQLVERLVQAETAAAEAYARQEMQAQNRWADRREAAIRDLLSRGTAGRVALEMLLEHDSPVVRGVAAAHAIKWAPERAVPVLEELLGWAHAERDADGLRSPTAGFVLFNAEVLLSQYYGIELGEVIPHVLGSGA